MSELSPRPAHPVLRALALAGGGLVAFALAYVAIAAVVAVLVLVAVGWFVVQFLVATTSRQRM